VVSLCDLCSLKGELDVVESLMVTGLSGLRGNDAASERRRV